MTSKEAIENIKRTMIIRRHGNIDVGIKYNREILTIEKDLEVLEIIKKNPEIVWWCCCYKTAEEMIIDRKGFMLDYSVEEIRKQFNKIKEWLENDK